MSKSFTPLIKTGRIKRMDKQQISPEDQQRFRELLELEKTKETLEKTRPENIADAIASAGIDYPEHADEWVPERSSVNRKVRKRIKIKKALQKKSRRRNR